MKKLKKFGMILLMAILVTASGTGVVKADTATLTLNKSTATIKVGETLKLKATKKGINQSVSWSSSDKSVATVSSSGKVTAKKAGKCTITAKAGSYKATCKVTVAFQLSDKQYKAVKGWWTQASSGGCDVKFTRTKVKYYSREDGKVVRTYTIKKCKKINGVYSYYLKGSNGTSEIKFQLRLSEEYKNGESNYGLEFYGTWDESQLSNTYSGSSSMSKGKWG
jgi:transglutaminase/protease-like cytokinesis protein 3